MRKELSTFRAVWNWARVTTRVEGPFPNKGLRFPKTHEKPPFQTKEEVNRQIARGGLSEMEQEALWDCLYLTPADLETVLKMIKERANQPVVYPMVLMAAHTGARRSEILRSQVQDFDLHSNFVVIREKKRAKGRRTTRVSTMLTSRYGPGGRSGLLGGRFSSRTTFSAENVRFPPSGMASRALTARFMITCSS